MNQICMDFVPVARATDPATSHQAAAQARELAADHHRIILAALEAHGPLGKDGIALRTSLTGVAVCRRLTELQRMGRIVPTGRNVQSTAGRAEREWRTM
jgi:predicted ArsR family transcriptional regulator